MGPFLVEEKPGFIQSDTEEAMFELFSQAHPDIKIKLSQYKEELPWNMMRGRQDSTWSKTTTVVNSFAANHWYGHWLDILPLVMVRMTYAYSLDH